MQQQQQYVGIDLHRRRSVIVRMTETGEVLSTVQIDNDPVALALAIAEAGPDPEVALECTYGWYWAADLLQAEGARVHLVHPLGLHWDTRRVKNDVRDATALANRLRQNDLPESWIAPPAVREMREIVRYRAKLTALRTSAKAQIHAVMAKHGICPSWTTCSARAARSCWTRCPSRGCTGCGWNRCGTCSRSTTGSWPWWSARCASHVQRPRRLQGHPGHHRGGPGDGGHLRAPRSATSAASRPPGICARGRV